MHAVKALALSLALGLALAGAVQASTLLESGPIIRPTFDTNFWCPINFYWVGIFTADGPDVTVELVAQNRATLGNLPMRQRIDNFALLERSIYEANLGPSTVGPKQIFCVNVGDELFFFQDVAPQDFVHFEQFETGLDPGWDLSDGAFYVDSSVPGSSAPNDLRNPIPDPTGGSLGLGEETNMAPTVSTRITLTGFQAGVEYVVHFWWRSKVDDDENGDPYPDGDLFVTVLGSGPVPVEPTTWGDVKAAFRSE